MKWSRKIWLAIYFWTEKNSIFLCKWILLSCENITANSVISVSYQCFFLCVVSKLPVVETEAVFWKGLDGQINLRGQVQTTCSPADLLTSDRVEEVDRNLLGCCPAQLTSPLTLLPLWRPDQNLKPFLTT